jgi:Ca-activated chloride channel family protein
MVRLAGALTLAAVVAIPGISQAQERRTVYASVLDREGAPVASLSARDFVVTEDGAAREVLSATKADEPMQIAVLVDTSQAATRYVQDVRNAVRAFVRELAGQNQIALMEFGDRPTVITNYTLDLEQLERGVNRLFARQGSGAYSLDALVDASKDLQRREGSRHVIVLISTEGPEFSERYHRQVLDELRSAATLHAFVLTRRGASRLDDGRRERELTLTRGPSDTGGRSEFLITSMALEGRLRSLANELENQYRVEYARPSSLLPPEKIDVEVKTAGLTVRAPRTLVTARRTGS